MKRLFVDTDVIIDLLANRIPHSKYAVHLFNLAENSKVALYTSTHSIATVHYLMKKYSGEKELRSILLDLLKYILPISIDHLTLIKGLKSTYPDFEDALQIIAAESINDMEMIVTRNLKDFKTSPVKAVSPEEALALMDL